jgi:dimethylglycine dehydrogenase
MGARAMDVGLAPAVVVRVSLTGERSYEIHAEHAYLPALYRAAKRAVTGVRDVGTRAMLSLRLEKGLGVWSREFSPDYTAAESGLDRFVDFARVGFVGREAALREREAPPARRLALLRVDAADSDANGYEPLWAGDRLAGFVTSGGFGHRVGASLALGYVDRGIGAEAELAVDLLGERRAAKVLGGPAFDPAGLRMRG